MGTNNDYDKLLQKIGSYFQQIRYEKKDKITSVAYSIGVTHPVISQIENGRYKSLSLLLLVKLANYYQVNLQEIFVYTGDIPAMNNMITHETRLSVLEELLAKLDAGYKQPQH